MARHAAGMFNGLHTKLGVSSDTTRINQTTYRGSTTTKNGFFVGHRCLDLHIHVQCTCTIQSIIGELYAYKFGSTHAHALIQVVLLIHRQQRQFAQNQSTFS